MTTSIKNDFWSDEYTESTDFTTETTKIVHEGDYVIDPMDFEIRQVQYVRDDDVFFTDGGVMGIDEVDEILLESEIGTPATDELIRQKKLNKQTDLVELKTRKLTDIFEQEQELRNLKSDIRIIDAQLRSLELD